MSLFILCYFFVLVIWNRRTWAPIDARYDERQRSHPLCAFYVNKMTLQSSKRVATSDNTQVCSLFDWQGFE